MTSLNSTSHGTPQNEDKRARTPSDRSEVDTISSTTIARTLAFERARNGQVEDPDTALERQHLTKQLKTLAQELKRTRAQAATIKALGGVEVEPAEWSVRELKLVNRAVEKWKSLRTYKMAEEILSGAVGLREANVIA